MLTQKTPRAGVFIVKLFRCLIACNSYTDITTKFLRK